MKETCIIVIPVYKECATLSEMASFKQCLTILSNYDICLITFKELNLNIYRQISDEIGKNILVEYFDQEYFLSINGYNKLCLSLDLYNRFILYKYMLIYQLDAWVFSDQIEYWCKKDYDYIGAPNFYLFKQTQQYSKIYMGVGNGGLSLRKIEYCERLLSKNYFFPYLKPSFLWELYYTSDIKIPNLSVYSKSFLLVIGKVFLKMFGYKNNIKYLLDSDRIKVNEDFVLSVWASHAWEIRANIPSCDEASYFSFEANPSYLYKKNGTLPFGCHAFEKWEFETFWSKFIKIIPPKNKL